MDATFLIAALLIATFLAVIAFALVSKKKVDERRETPSAPKSTLAVDTPDQKQETPASWPGF